MKIYDYKRKGLELILSHFRMNSDIAAIVKSIAIRFDSLQSIVEYLLNCLNISKARGQRLDYIGAEVGASRDEVDYGSYFCVNRLHINEDVNFYFLSSGDDPRTPLSLPDAEYIQKIFAYVGANSSCGEMESILKTIQKITNVANVEVVQSQNGGLKINICGDGLIITRNTLTYIKQILGDGIYLEEITTND